MIEWYTAAELAGVPGLPTTERRVRDQADRQTWAWRPREGRGGGREYHLSALPALTQAALTKQAAAGVADPAAQAAFAHSRREQVRATIDKAAEQTRRLQGLGKSAFLRGKALTRAESRERVIVLLKAFKQDRGLPMKAARIEFARAYNDRVIEIEAELRAALPRISAPSLLRWQRLQKREGIAALAGGYGNRKGQTSLTEDSPIGKIVVGMLAVHPNSSAKHIMDALRAKLGRDSLPKYRSLQRFIATWKEEHRQTFTALANPDAWKGRYMMAAGSASEDVTGLNHRWEMDSTPADVMLADGRHSIIGVIDVWSRRARLLVSRTSKSAAVASLLRRAILEWGVPREVKTDNGQDYTSKHLVRVLDHLDVEHTLCRPFSPWQKPHIERFFRTFSHDLVELLPGYIGHDVAEREAIRARKSFADRLMKKDQLVELALTADELQDVCDRWCADLYAHQDHSGLKGKTPFARAAEWRELTHRVSDARALDVLLAEAPGDGWRSVGKKGLQIDGGFFLAPELEAHVGRRVQVRYDETDLGRVYVFDADDAFLCIAEDPARLGVSPKEAAEAIRRRQRERVQEERRALKQIGREADLDNIAREILAEASANAGRVLAFPAPSTDHETPQLTAAADAAAFAPRQPAALTDDQRQAADEAWTRMTAPALRVATSDGRPVFEDDKEFAEWVMANPDKATASDQAHLADLMKDRSFRQWLGVDEERAAAG